MWTSISNFHGQNGIRLHNSGAVLIAILLAIFLAACDGLTEEGRAKRAELVATEKAAQARKAAQQQEFEERARAIKLEQVSRDLSQSCRDSLPAKRAEYKKLMDARQFWPASVQLNECARKLDDIALLALVRDAQRKSFLQELSDPTSSADSKSAASKWLVEHYPGEAKQFKVDAHRLLAKEAERRRQTVISEARQLSAEKRKSGVQVGMDMDDVAASSWGRPTASIERPRHPSGENSGYTVVTTICTLKMGC